MKNGNPFSAKVDILLADDNQSDISATLNTLKEARICNHVHVLSRGAQILDFLSHSGSYANATGTTGPILVLLSMNLADAHGLDILRQIKNDERTKATPVIILTSSQEERGIMKSYKLGADGCIVKPVDLKNFNEAISDLQMGWLLLSTDNSKSECCEVEDHVTFDG